MSKFDFAFGYVSGFVGAGLLVVGFVAGVVIGGVVTMKGVESAVKKEVSKKPSFADYYKQREAEEANNGSDL